jgi:hypothetical protein
LFVEHIEQPPDIGIHLRDEIPVLGRPCAADEFRRGDDRGVCGAARGR